MSTGCECHFIEVKPGEWFYVLQHTHARKNAWDWRDEATAYGPFPLYDDANLHLQQNHANPGGHSTFPYIDGFEPDATLAELIAEARA